MGFQKLAEDLRTETSPAVILERLKSLVNHLTLEKSAGKMALALLRADGSRTIVRLLRGTPTENGTPDRSAMSCAISDLAGHAYFRWRMEDAVDIELSGATYLIPSLFDALRDAPTMLGRSVAIQVLAGLTTGRPQACQAMVEAGVVKHLVAFYFALYNDTRGPPEGFCDPLELSDPAGILVGALSHWAPGVMDHLRDAVRAKKAVDVFPALLLTQVCDSCAYCTFGGSG
jgi:hypothetical protein